MKTIRIILVTLINLSFIPMETGMAINAPRDEQTAREYRAEKQTCFWLYQVFLSNQTVPFAGSALGFIFSQNSATPVTLIDQFIGATVPVIFLNLSAQNTTLTEQDNNSCILKINASAISSSQGVN